MKALLTLMIAAVFATAFATTGSAQTVYLARPVTLVVPFPPGWPATCNARSWRCLRPVGTSRLANSAGTTPAQFRQLIGGDRKRYAQIIRERKITVN